MAMATTLESSTATVRPTHWTFASPDLNVLLSGHLVTPLEGQPQSVEQSGHPSEGVQFQLDAQGIYIEHPALVSITTTPTSQTLSSLNTGQPILTLSTPLLPPSKSPSPSPSSSPASTTATPPEPKPSIVTLHSPLLTPNQVAELQKSQLYSSTFHLLLDGPDFLPPKFDPHSIEPPPTPLVGASGSNPTGGGGQGHILNSPTLQRALLSPLLSPQRRAHSQGSDISVPPLSLGLSRARAPSLSAPSGPSHNRNGSASSSSPATRPQTGLEALLPLSTSRPSLEALLSTSISSAAKSTAEEIMSLRRSHDFFVKRAKLELHVLQTRVSNATNHAVAAPGGGLVVKGFRNASKSPGGSETRRESLSREESRERSVERGTSEERGRARAAGGSRKDEKVSEGIRESDRREEEERGRSRSRVRRGAPTNGERAPSKTGKAVKEVVEAAAGKAEEKESKVVLSPTLSPSTKPQAGQSISAFIDDSAPSSPTTAATSSSQAIPESEDTQNEASASMASPMFVPSSHALVSIPETEELSLPASEAGDGENEERDEEMRGREQREQNGSDQEEEETEHPFEMDEDLDVDPLTLSSAPPSTSPPEFDAPSPALPPTTTTSQSFRPGSMARPSTLSASYNALLSSSLANRPSSSPSHLKSPPSLPAPSTSPYGTHFTSTSVREDVQTSLDFVPRPDAHAARIGEEKIRQVLAMDAPSHRRVLPSRRRPVRRQSSGEEMFDEEEGESEEEELEEDRTNRMAIGSLPISIGFARPQPSSSFRPPGERELMRKTSVPGREGMFVPPLLNPGTKAPVVGGGGGVVRRKSGKKEQRVEPEMGSKASQSRSQGGPAQAMNLPSPSSKIDVTPSSSTSRPTASSSSNHAGLSSSLAQSLRAHPGQGVRSFSQVVEEEEEAEQAEISNPSTASGSKTQTEDGEEDTEEDGEEFVPPHEFVLRGRRDEEMLSRSVTSY